MADRNLKLAHGAQITPGTWEAVRWSCGAATTIKAGDIVIAECSGFGRYADESLADACLIATAPELLAACVGLLHIAETGVVSVGAIRAARAALAKVQRGVSS